VTERSCLYAANQFRRAFLGEINHPPWPLELAEADSELNTMASVHGISLVGQPHCHFARQLDVVDWPLDRIA